MEQTWKPISELPEPGYRYGRYWVIVEGEKFHSGIIWARKDVGLARTQNDGFYPEDIRKIEEDGGMDKYSGNVTHFMEIKLPSYPI